nr:cytochrome ubiquinol oxidase subunit I [Actinomycetota bacterium]
PQSPDMGGYALAGGHETLATSLLDAQPQAVLEMPHESPWPVLLAAALAVMFYGILLDAYALAALGALGGAGGLIGWFWPRGETQET